MLIESDFVQVCRMLKIRVTRDQKHTARYLENIGLRFCVHFGTENMQAIAKKHWRDRRNARRRALRQQRKAYA